jgi:hypothetical protein
MMRMKSVRKLWWRAGALMAGSAFFLEGCDPTLRATTEDGIISLSSSLVTAVIRAIINVAEEGPPTETARAIIEVAQQIVT